MKLRAVVTALALAAQGPAFASDSPTSTGSTPRPGAPAATAGPIPLLWRASTMSPIDADSSDPLYEICGRAESALVTVATRNASRQRRGEPSFSSDELAFNLRAAGAPYVWPRAWTIKGATLDAEKVAGALRAFVEKSKALGERRCGVSRVRDREGAELVSVVMVDVLADLARTPVLTRVGEWVSVRGTMVTEAADTKVVLLGPRGTPRTILASLVDKEIRATFNVDQSGEWLVQVLATVSTGPRPVIELTVHAGTPPPLRFAESEAPGENAAAPDAPLHAALYAMVNAARRSEGKSPLMRDSSLDEIAARHSEAMQRVRVVGHDVGDGGPGQRLAEAGFSATHTGENVAGAASIVRAHRALWLSPSHRGNLLDARFTRLGLGVTQTEDGRVWVTQLFAD
jgi:uncharacterized protein YkwD